MIRRTFSVSARWIIPVCEPPIENGVVVVEDGIIRQVLQGRLPNADLVLEDQILLPQLVNAHTHLEFSDLEQPIGTRGNLITDWIPQVVRSRMAKRPNEKETDIDFGLQQSMRFGTCAVGDIATGNEFAAETHGSLVTTFLECLGNRPEAIDDVLDRAKRFLNGETKGVQRGISPHAPYSVHPRLFGELVRLASQFNLPVAMHLAESREEEEWIRDGGGPFKGLLQDLGALNSEVQIPGRSFLDFLEPLSKCSRVLIVHGNYLDQPAMELIADNRLSMHVVYCPRTHDFFGHEPYPLQELLECGINVAIGTDSLASNPDLSIWRELVHVRKTQPQLSPLEILALGTKNGASALGYDQSVGCIAPGFDARMMSLQVSGDADPIDDIFDTALEPKPLEI